MVQLPHVPSEPLSLPVSDLRIIVRWSQPCVGRHLGNRVRIAQVGPVGHLGVPGDTEPHQYVLHGSGV